MIFEVHKEKTHIERKALREGTYFPKKMVRLVLKLIIFKEHKKI